jgi:hypothetical protein
VAKRHLRKLQYLSEVIHNYDRGADGREPSADLFQPPSSTALSAGDYHIDVSEAKLSDRPFSEELDDADINTWIHKVLAHGADLNPGVCPHPLEGRGLRCARSMPWGVTLPEDAARWEVSHALNTKLQVQKQRRHA